MTNPHDAPSRHSRKWDEEEKKFQSQRGSNYEGYSSGDSWRSGDSWSSSSGGYGRNPTNWTGSYGNYPYKRRSGKKAAIVISAIMGILALVILAGGIDIQNFEISDLTKIINPCQEYNTIQFNIQQITGKISLQLCNDSDLTLSSKLSKSAKVQINLYDSKSKSVYQKTFVGDDFEHIIPAKYYESVGNYKIKTKVNGNNVPGELIFQVK